MGEKVGSYPGLAIVGGGGLCALYGTAGSPPGGWGTGVQHLFLHDYQQDLIHTATTLVRLPTGEVEWGNRAYDYRSHPERLRPVQVFSLGGTAFVSQFRCRSLPVLTRTETLQAVADGVLEFEVSLRNDGTEPLAVEVYALVIFRPDPSARAEVAPTRPAGAAEPGIGRWRGSHVGKHLAVAFPGADLGGVQTDSPTGFLYRTVQSLRLGALLPSAQTFTPALAEHIGLLLGRTVHIEPKATLSLTWRLGAGASPAEAESRATVRADGAAYWESWFGRGARRPFRHPELAEFYRANLAALRGALMPDGFVPADMSGQYFANGAPSYYARDALMVARSFCLAGYVEESQAILRYLADRPVNPDGASFQRYDARGLPAEGQNNGVSLQLDSQGYFARLLYVHWRRTGRLPVPFPVLSRALDALGGRVGPRGMVGPEGGVNEGVFGPAYITSTNMCIHGGLTGGIMVAEAMGYREHASAWRRLRDRIGAGIESAWDGESERYGYGFTAVAPELVRKYDTPQYFGPLYGYPAGARFRQNDRTLRRTARFLGAGVGYSEQEYHHGPWTFTTAACAEHQALVGNWREWVRIVRWLLRHSNQFGQMPESFSADDPRQCQVNPLVWGCAEAVAALTILGTEDGEREGRLPGSDRFLDT